MSEAPFQRMASVHGLLQEYLQVVNVVGTVNLPTLQGYAGKPPCHLLNQRDIEDDLLLTVEVEQQVLVAHRPAHVPRTDSQPRRPALCRPRCLVGAPIEPKSVRPGMS